MIDTQELFSILERLYQAETPARNRYNVVSSIFNLIADELTRDSDINFTGLLPRIDYLIRHHHTKNSGTLARRISSNLASQVHNLRYRLSRIDSYTDTELTSTLPNDIATLSRWISFLMNEDIPVGLRENFPITPLHTATSMQLNNCCRVIVDNVDGEFIHARAEGDEMAQLRIRYRTATSDFSYLLPAMSPGTQLNIVEWKRESDKSITPGLIIFEPDYLIDISGIAECFETYAVSPTVGIIKKIQPEQISKAILLGGFAGQLLDEALHRKDGEKFDYRDAITDFFKTGALKMAACNDLDRQFHTEAMEQQRNIEHTIKKVLPAIDGYNPEKIIVEPSFFCETLGLQGRMDMLQTDFTILVEQKSGKGRFGSDEHGSPLHQEKHLVQLLLYQAVLHHGLNVPKSAINSFLLYSKYPRPLIKPGNAPQLLRKAFEIRNLAVVQEIKLSQPDGFSILDNLTPELLNENAISGKLWDKYVKPQLSSLLKPYAGADALKKAYVKRLLQFIAMEQLCAKTGFNAVATSSGFSGAWLTPLSEKKNQGNIYDGLSISDLDCDDRGSVKRITLEIDSDTDSGTANFRTGDIVILYPYRKEKQPDLRRSITIRASIETLSENRLTLLLRSPQSNRSFFNSSSLWAIEHDLLDASFRGLYRAVYSLLSATDSRADLILGRREPQLQPAVPLNGEYGQFNEMVAKARRSRDIFAIIGPPGTGKTSFGMLNILREELIDPESAIIVTAYTNRAVDEICSKLTDTGIPFTRVGSSLGCNPEYRDSLLSTKTDSCKTVAEVRTLLKSTRVVTGTLQAITAASPLFAFKKFNLAIVDEASQILEPHILGLLCACSPDGTPAIGRFVMIGDHKQLPAVVRQPVEKSTVNEENLRQIGMTDCRRSFFERFLENAIDDTTGNYNPNLVYEFSRQGRMHADISSLASSLFYDNRLNVVPLPHQTAGIPQLTDPESEWAILNRQRTVFINVTPPEGIVTGNANEPEAEVIASVLLEIYQRECSHFDPELTVGVIVPYRNQISAIKQAISRLGIPGLNQISIDTVERFQGSQRDYIIYGFTVAQPHQLAFLTSNRFMENGDLIDRKLNVALTRARSHLILIGNRQLLSTDRLFSKVIESCTKAI